MHPPGPTSRMDIIGPIAGWVKNIANDWWPRDDVVETRRLLR
jgi:hypothetical protein